MSSDRWSLLQDYLQCDQKAGEALLFGGTSQPAESSLFVLGKKWFKKHCLQYLDGREKEMDSHLMREAFCLLSDIKCGDGRLTFEGIDRFDHYFNKALRFRVIDFCKNEFFGSNDGGGISSANDGNVGGAGESDWEWWEIQKSDRDPEEEVYIEQCRNIFFDTLHDFMDRLSRKPALRDTLRAAVKYYAPRFHEHDAGSLFVLVTFLEGGGGQDPDLWGFANRLLGKADSHETWHRKHSRLRKEWTLFVKSHEAGKKLIEQCGHLFDPDRDGR